MGGDLADAAVSGAKDASGNVISTTPSERHMSISLAPGSGLSQVLDDVTAAYICLLQRRDDERDNELAALRVEVAQMKQRMQQDATPATSRSGGGGGRGRQTPPSPPPPPPSQGHQNEGGQRRSVKDRLGFTPAPGDAREIILYKQPTASGTHRSRNHHCPQVLSSCSAIAHYNYKRVLGACWYILSIERQEACWRYACSLEKPSSHTGL